MSVNRVDELPLRLLLRIFSFLDRGMAYRALTALLLTHLLTHRLAAGDLAKCGMTCKLFGRLYNHDSLWKRLFCKQWSEAIGYAFVGNWKYRYKARLQYIQSRKRPDFLPSLRKLSFSRLRSRSPYSGLDTPNNRTPVASDTGDNSSSSSSSEGILASTAKTAPIHGHWVAERIVDSQPKVGT